jgi:hypothetical protein
MPHYYTTLQQFLEAYDAQPILYAQIDDDSAFGSVDHYVAITSLVLETSGGSILGYKGNAVNFGELAEVVSQDIETAQAIIGLDAFNFTSSLLNYYVRIYLGDTKLTTDQHLLLYEGQIVAENRAARIFTVSIQDNVYLKLLKSFTPQFQIKNEAAIAATAPAASQNKYAPIVVGQLLSTGTTATGRIRATAITNVTPGVNDFLVCEHEFGAVFTVSAVYQNGSPVAIVANEILGATFSYIKVTVAASNPTDDITVDITRRTTNPIDELRLFLNRAGIPDTDLDLASFTAAQTVATNRNYKLGGKVEEPTQLLEIVSSWLESFSARAVLKGGKFGITIRDYIYDFDAPDFTEHAHIINNSATIEKMIEEVVNVFVYEALFDPDNTALATGSESDSASISTYSRRERNISLPWAGDLATTQDVAQRLIFDWREPRDLISFRSHLFAMSVDILDTIRVTTEDKYRVHSEITRRNLSGSDFSVAIEALDISELVANAFRLGAEESKAADAPHLLPANDPRNCNVTGSIDDGGTLTTGAATNTLTRAGGVSFVTRDVKVGDFVTLFQLAGGVIPVNLGTYEIFEGALAIGLPITTANTLTVEDPNTGAAVAFTGAEVITYWWIYRSWATADSDQKRQGYITQNNGLMSDLTPGKVLT